MSMLGMNAGQYGQGGAGTSGMGAGAWPGAGGMQQPTQPAPGSQPPAGLNLWGPAISQPGPGIAGPIPGFPQAQPINHQPSSQPPASSGGPNFPSQGFLLNTQLAHPMGKFGDQGRGNGISGAGPSTNQTGTPASSGQQATGGGPKYQMSSGLSALGANAQPSAQFGAMQAQQPTQQPAGMQNIPQQGSLGALGANAQPGQSQSPPQSQFGALGGQQSPGFSPGLMAMYQQAVNGQGGYAGANAMANAQQQAGSYVPPGSGYGDKGSAPSLTPGQQASFNFSQQPGSSQPPGGGMPAGSSFWNGGPTQTAGPGNTNYNQTNQFGYAGR